MSDCSAAQRYADLSRFRLVLPVRDAMRSHPQCTGLDLDLFEERPHLVKNDLHFGRDRLPKKEWQLRFGGCSTVVAEFFIIDILALPVELLSVLLLLVAVVG